MFTSAQKFSRQKELHFMTCLDKSDWNGNVEDLDLDLLRFHLKELGYSDLYNLDDEKLLEIVKDISQLL